MRRMMPQRSAHEGDTASEGDMRQDRLRVSLARATGPLTDRALRARIDESFDRDAVHLDVDVKHVDLAETVGLALVPKARDKNDDGERLTIPASTPSLAPYSPTRVRA
jgi:ethanolamine ammonia-lyase small subunit